MKILSFGSLNYDHCYTTDHFVMPGETLSTQQYACNYGGKGLNQSIALARAGLKVFHAGRVGKDGDRIMQYLKETGVDTTYIQTDEKEATGHAIIEVHDGENRILLYGGTNQCIDEKQIDETLKHFASGDVLVLQNEISNLSYLIRKASDLGMRIFFNAAPMNEKVNAYSLELVDTIIVNETEGKALSHCESEDNEEILHALHEAYPKQKIVLTVGKDGSYYQNGETVYYEPACKTKAVDTTGAGDTYTGYFIAMLLMGKETREAMRIATKASCLSVQKAGASTSIPTSEEVQNA